ncbi:hypothetical protein L0B53_02185 [Vibrio sp. SS-MA-C1-2]|uniref:hypothetical protein n=1 Tax=Vibrio sp. SS-MA-C1-2 TaxID=2908646 RepID=UPI001F368ADD|nr:hypothetical protein [Vibrio sp. SS-MA-C1-2]UJF17599.1 hypothetical protein L0B53_02185 [Vibrio sp. SS-MA-C1-2]
MRNPNVIMQNKITELFKYAKFLRKIAWIVEFIVVFIGLSISVFLVTSTDASTSAFILAAPFVMISIVEFAKIPFVVGLWHAKKSFLLYLLMIVLLCTLTFETLLNGFERAFSTINEQINLKEIEISKIENDIKINQDNASILSDEYNEKLTKYEQQEQEIESEFTSSYQQAVRRNSINARNTPALKKALDAAKKDLTQLKIEKADLLKELSEKKEQKFKDSINRLDDSENVADSERNRLLAKLSQLESDRETALNDANFFTRDGVKREYDEKIRYTNEQLNNINDKTITGDKPDENFDSVKFLDNYYSDLLSLKDDVIKQKQQDVKELTRRYQVARQASSNQLARQKK